VNTFWNPDDRRALGDRLERLTPQTAARWGRLTAPEVIVHLCDGFRMAAGELPCAPKKLPIRFFPLKQLFVYVLPMPKNAPTAPELLTRPPGEWSGDMEDLRTIMERLASGGPSQCAAEHPAFGRMSGRGWGVLAYKHTDHHLRQFGL
jgi:hypothetical protein